MKKDETEKRRASAEAFKKWNEDRQPLHDSKNEVTFVADPDEEYVQAFEPNKGFMPSVYVGDKGNILNFKGAIDGKIFYVKPTLKEPDKPRPYLVTDAGRVNRVVWFSFLYDDIKTGKHRANTGIYKNLKESDMSWLKVCEVHHIDNNTQNNALENLQLNDKIIHRMMTALYRGHDETGILEKIRSLDTSHIDDGFIFSEQRSYPVDQQEFNSKIDGQFFGAITKLMSSPEFRKMRSEDKAESVNVFIKVGKSEGYFKITGILVEALPEIKVIDQPIHYKYDYLKDDIMIDYDAFK